MKLGDRVALLSYAEIARLPGVQSAKHDDGSDIQLDHPDWGGYCVRKYDPPESTILGDRKFYTVRSVDGELFKLLDFNRWSFHTSWVETLFSMTTGLKKGVQPARVWKDIRLIRLPVQQENREGEQK